MQQLRANKIFDT